MGLFSRKPLVCPVCSQDVVVGPADRTGFGHFATHLDDVRGPGSPLRFACGCPDAVFDISGNFPNEVMRHLKARHGLNVRVT
jgi:hypothetical protein